MLRRAEVSRKIDPLYFYIYFFLRDDADEGSYGNLLPTLR